MEVSELVDQEQIELGIVNNGRSWTCERLTETEFKNTWRSVF